MTVAPFPMSADAALRIIREAAADSGCYTIPDPPVSGEWYRLVNRRQVEWCLREGGLMGRPVIDEQGSLRATLERFSAGVVVRVDVVLWKEDAGGWNVAVINVEKQP